MPSAVPADGLDISQERWRINVTQIEFTHARRFNRLKPGIDTGQAIPPELIQGNKPLLKGYGWL
jgi:hypothetical protein